MIRHDLSGHNSTTIVTAMPLLLTIECVLVRTLPKEVATDIIKSGGKNLGNKQSSATFLGKKAKNYFPQTFKTDALQLQSKESLSLSKR